MKTELKIKYGFLGNVKEIEFKGNIKQYDKLCEILKLEEDKKKELNKLLIEVNTNGSLDYN